jgi:hypothetical protein
VRIPKFHDITYVWDFGDAANATPPIMADMTLPAAWKNINRAYGMRVAHVFNDPGTYTVTVTAYEPATRRKGSASVTVTIGDPKTVFPGNRTIIYDPSGTGDPANYPSADVRTTWSGVISARNARGAQTCQILIAPGVTIANTTLVSSPSGWSNIRIGALDPAGARPVITRNDQESGSNSFFIKDYNTTSITERVVFGLRFVGDWDSTTETGRVYRPFATNGVGAGLTYLAMQHRCEFDGLEVVSGQTGDFTSYTFYLCHSEVHVTNWQDYGLHGCNKSNGHTAVIACRSQQHPDALSVAVKDKAMYNQHGPLRDFGSQTIFVSVCELFSRNGWSTGGSGVDGLSLPSDQACLRINTQGRTGVKANVERVAMEGLVWLEEQGKTSIDVPGNYVFDKWLQVINGMSIQEAIKVNYGGMSFRNGLTIAPNVPPARTSSFFRKCFTLDNGRGTPDNDAGISIYNCTFVDLRTNANAANGTVSFVEQSGFANVTIENNITHQPNRSPASVPDGPLDLTTSTGFVTRHRGFRRGFLWESGTLATAVAPDDYFTLSYANVKTSLMQGGNAADYGSPTDQAYWQANTGGTNHRLNLSGITNRGLHAQYGEIEVTFEPTEIRVYNRTASTWSAGWTWDLKLDRRIYLPAWNPALDYRNLLIPLARPQAGSAAIGSGGSGLKAYDDFLGTVRPGATNTRGALLPA